MTQPPSPKDDPDLHKESDDDESPTTPSYKVFIINCHQVVDRPLQTKTPLVMNMESTPAKLLYLKTSSKQGSSSARVGHHTSTSGLISGIWPKGEGGARFAWSSNARGPSTRAALASLQAQNQGQAR